MIKKMILLFTVLLSACSPAAVSMEDYSSGDVVLQDSFSDPSSGWERTSMPLGSMDYYNGVYRMIVNASEYDLWTTTKWNFADVRIEVDAARYGGPEENRFGLICRYQDTGNYYFFVVSSDGYYGLGAVREGEILLMNAMMMQYSPAILPGMAPNHLRLDCVGDVISVYVNGIFLHAFQDAAFVEGKTGLLAGSFETTGIDIVFDEFLVIKP